MKFFVIIAVVLIVPQYPLAQSCQSRSFGNDGTVCVCTDSYCDTIPPIQKIKEAKYIKITSNRAGLRFDQEEGSFTKLNGNSENLIEIGTDAHQEILGFGGAFTDSTGINIKSLNSNLQEKLIRSYFSDEGLEYSVGRVPIGGTDFSVEAYSYCDTENDTPDPELVNFNLTFADYEYKIPIIQKALDLRNNTLDLFGSAWIAPNWMKTRPGFLKRLSFIKDDMYQSWANYFLKFLKAYKENNISFWGITTGNEPTTAFVPVKIPSVAWIMAGAIKFIKNNLGPTLRGSEFSNINIIAIDDQKILLPWVPDLLFLDEDVKTYVDGFGVHWYADTLSSPKLLDQTHERYPNKFILATEASNGAFDNTVKLGSWDRAEKYADNILMDLNHWVIGWTDWNMALNMQGGPTFINNFVDSPIIVNSQAGEFYKQPMYYALAHFSKTIPKGSLRLDVSSFCSDIPVNAFKRPDGSTAVVVLNKLDKDVSVSVRDPTRGDISINLTAKSITSIVYW